MQVSTEQDKKPDIKKYGRGRIAPKSLASLRHAANKRNGATIAALRKTMPAAPAAFDATAKGWVCAVIDQGQCGSCWDFSGTEMCSSAFIKAGAQPTTFLLSTQYTLDCYNNGGCNGDDNTTVLAHCKSTGLPTEADYGPYTASSGKCKYTTQKLYLIQDWGFCTSGNQQGVAATADIKTALMAYGAIGTGVDASDFDSYSGGVMSGRNNSTNIDHDVMIVGWDDTKGKSGAWKVQNSWGTSWGLSGYCWMEYTSWGIGTEAVWCMVPGSPPPVPPVPPVPPGPIPPTPGTTATLMLNGTGTALDGKTFELSAQGSAVLFQTAMAAMKALSDANNPVPGPVPVPLPIEQRMSKVEANITEILNILKVPPVASPRLQRLEDQMNRLEKILNGK